MILKDFSRFGLVDIDEEGRIRNLEEKPIVAKSDIVSCGIYLIRRRMLINLIEECVKEKQIRFCKRYYNQV